MQYVSFPSSALDSRNRTGKASQIQSAVLRDDGSVYVKTSERPNAPQCIDDTPNRLTQIAIAIDGLWGIDSKGILHHWNGQVVDSQWTVDSSIGTVKAIIGMADGRLCAITKSGKALIRQPKGLDSGQIITTSRSTNDPVSPVWNVEPEVTDWLKPQREHPSRNFSFGLRSLLFCFLLLSVILGPWSIIQRGYERESAIQQLTKQGANIRYAHEFDEAGTLINNAAEPGPDWLKRLVGRQLFVTPVQLNRYNEPLDLSLIGKLTSLRRLQLGKWKELTDITPLGSLTKLEEFSICDTKVSDISPLSRMQNLRRLHLSREKNLTDISPLKFLKQLEELALDESSVKDIGPLKHLTKLEILDLSECEILSLEPILSSTQLRKLKYNAWKRRKLHPEMLRGLQHLTDLNVDNMEYQKSSEWLNEFENISSFGITAKDRFTNGPSKLNQLPSAAPPTPMIWMGAPPAYLNGFSATHSDPSTIVELSQCPHLDFVRLDQARISDLQPLRDLSKLVGLSLRDTLITDLQSIQSLLPQFKTLRLDGAPIADLAPLSKSVSLIEISAPGSPVSDISCLSECRELRKVNFSGTTVSNIEVAANWPKVFNLYLNDTPIDDINVLTNLKNLLRVGLKNTNVVDLKGLASFDGSEIDLEGSQIVSLDALRNANFKKLNIAKTNVADLLPLQGHQDLKELNASDTQVSDLTPMRKLSGLTILQLKHTPVADASVLKRIGLKKVDLSDTPIVTIPDWSDRRHTGLLEINLSGTKVIDITPLGRLPSYQRGSGRTKIDLSRTPATDFSPLMKLKRLAELNLSETKVTDISQLPMVRRLLLSKTNVEDLSGIRNQRFKSSPGVEGLDLSFTNVVKLKPLAKLEDLASLNLEGTQVDDFSPLATLSKLQNVNLSKTSFTDPSVLLESALHLDSLDVSDTPFENLRGLVPMTQLGILNLSGTQIVDLKPVEQFLPYGLDYLDLTGCAVSDINPLARLRGLLHLKLNAKDLQDLRPLESMIVLETLRLENVSVELDLSSLTKLKFVTQLEITGEIGDVSELKPLYRVKDLRLPAGTRIPDDFVESIPTLRRLAVGDVVIYSKSEHKKRAEQ